MCSCRRLDTGNNLTVSQPKYTAELCVPEKVDPRNGVPSYELYFEEMLYLNNSNATTFRYYLPKAWVHLMR